MKLTMDDITPWIVPGVLSVALHAVIIGLFFGFRGCEGTPPPPLDDPPEVAQTAEPTTPEAAEPAPEKPTAAAKSRSGAATAAAAVRPKQPARTPPAKTVAGSPKPGEAPSPDVADTEVYEVKKGDNLTHLARRFNTTNADLAKLNGKDEKTFAKLQPGQKIKVPRLAY